MPDSPRPETISRLTRPEQLAAVLGLGDAARLDDAALRDFPLRVPTAFVSRMRPGDPHDPLLRQVWPAAEEAAEEAGWTDDPLDELDQRAAGGLIRKYAGRALLIATGACAIHCRYCFRRHFPYTESQAPRDWSASLAALAADPDIDEVILSGGDPLSLSDERLTDLVQGLDAIPHLRRLRIHTRLPVVMPERVGPELLQWLRGGRLQRIVVLHVNHAAELDGAALAACARLRETGALLLNQSVLLAGVNDSADALYALSEGLCAAGVVPYYLHLMDRVRGAAHFDVPADRAAVILRELRDRAPGYFVPRLVREEPGGAAKRWMPW